MGAGAAAAATVVQAKLSSTADYLTLLLFCLLATSSFLALELAVMFRPTAADARLKALGTWLDGAAWDEVPLSQSGWSAQRLDIARDYSHAKGSAAVVVVQHGAVVASWGDTATNLLLNSARKSLLSALMGIAVGNGQVHLDDTLARLGIDDIPPALTEAEKQATVRDLLEARSGVYHDANYGTPLDPVATPGARQPSAWHLLVLTKLGFQCARRDLRAHATLPDLHRIRTANRRTDRHAGFQRGEMPVFRRRRLAVSPPICLRLGPRSGAVRPCLCCAWGDGRIGRSFPPTGCRKRPALFHDKSRYRIRLSLVDAGAGWDVEGEGAARHLLGRGQRRSGRVRRAGL